VQSLPARIAALLGVVFVAVAVLLWIVMEAAPELVRQMSVEAAVGLVGVALAGAWCVLLPLARRLARMAAEAHAMAAEVARQNTLLAQAGRRRRELLSNVSHDLRTPLASMQGYLELLLVRHGSLDPAEAQNYLQIATRQSERLARLVGDLFELTRLEADDMQPQNEPFTIAELAQDVLQKFAADAARRGVALQAHCGADSAGALMVQADVALIERVFGNLVENALRHTAAGGAVAIEISAGDGVAELAVRDNGSGIAAEDLPSIFERYDGASRVGDGGGAGLGLAIARRIATLHGSQLRLSSEPGRGTRVAFDLPLAARPLRPARPPDAAARTA